MSAKTANGERRKKSRKSPPSLLYVELGPGNGGMIRDLSEEGFALRAMIPLHPGEKTPFSFPLNPSVRIEGQGEILWIKDNGRVAGIRFAEIAPAAIEQIQNWLNGTLEAPPTKEAEKAGMQDAQSFEQLREELRSAPPRGESRVSREVEPLPTPETVEKASSFIPETPLADETPKNVNVPAAAEHSPPLEAENPITSAPFPELPKIDTHPEAIEITFEPLAPVRDSVDEHFFTVQSMQQDTSTAYLTDEVSEVEPAVNLPDISAILIQPPSAERDYPSRQPVLEPLHAVKQGRVRTEGNWTDWFTLSRTVTIMVVLAAIVGITAFHRTFGQALIWLGGEMGGTQINQLPASDTNDVVSPGEVSRPAINPAESPSTTPSSNPPVTHRNESAQSSLPPMENNSAPPVTPLSGISAGAGSETGPETGLTEYSQAMRLLHGKNGEIDVSEAVRLLWISVEKGNPSAELTLAQLYWHGQGVARNCDQTRILLSAAARKGNADAQKLLRQFEQEGCE